jgi:membrane peptidoglycan carboxypeptidase
MVNSRTTEGIRNEMPRAYGMETTSNGKISYLGVNQPGSAIKPILVYGPAFDLRDETSGKALYTNNSIVDDTGEEPREGADPVGNSHGYHGMISIQEAIKGSSNVAAYRLYRDLYTNVKRSYAFNYLNKLNFQFLAQKDKTNLGVSIGGFEWGTTPLEMCAAYATIANDGEYRRPTAVLTVQSSANVANPLQFDESTIKGALTKSKKIYEQSTARRLTMAMQEVLTGSNGVYSGTAAGKGVSLDCAGKTGTTNGNRDAWFCGYTPCYTTSIWVGKDTNEKTSVQGGSVASIWQGFNQAVINKKKLSPSDYTFNLVIMDDSEPEEVFSLEPTETTFDFSSIDPFASLSPTNEWSETAQVFTIEPYTQTPTTDPWITNSPDPQQPTNNGNGGGPNSNEGEGPSSIPGFDPNNGNGSHGDD